MEDKSLENRTFIPIPFSMKDIPNADYIPDKPGELYDEVAKLRKWRDQSYNSNLLIS